MLIVFRYPDSTDKPASNGFNKVGYITSDGNVIFTIRNKVVRRNLAEILKLPHSAAQFSDPSKDQVDFDRANLDRFFMDNFQTPDLFNTGLTAIKIQDVAYFDRPIKLPRLEAIDDNLRTRRWNELKRAIQKGDLLFTFDSKSLSSKLISWVDNGPWSHCATCSGDGTVIEAITSGMVERPIDSYAPSRYRLGLYRLRRGTFDADKMIAFSRAQLGKPYNYRGALRAGFEKLTNRRRTVPTPNDLASNPDFNLVIYV